MENSKDFLETLNTAKPVLEELIIFEVIRHDNKLSVRFPNIEDTSLFELLGFLEVYASDLKEELCINKKDD